MKTANNKSASSSPTEFARETAGKGTSRSASTLRLGHGREATAGASGRSSLTAL